MREMARLTELPLKKVIRAEAGSILKACAGDTKVASVEQVSGRARRRVIKELELNRGDITINSGTSKRGAGTAGRIWAVSHGPRAKHRQYRLAFYNGNPVGVANNIRFTTPDWIDIEEAKQDYVRKIKMALEAAKRSIGLARQSWIQIADSLNIRLESVPGGRLSASGIAKARRALAKDGHPYVNGVSVEAEVSDGYYVDLVNRFPAGGRIGFARILFNAIRNRQKHFERALEVGVFKSEEKVAQQFPGFYVK